MRPDPRGANPDTIRPLSTCGGVFKLLSKTCFPYLQLWSYLRRISIATYISLQHVGFRVGWNSRGPRGVEPWIRRWVRSGTRGKRIQWRGQAILGAFGKE